MKKYFFTIKFVAVILTILLYSCQKANTSNTAIENTTTHQKAINSITDIDGNAYDTVVIGTQTWMVENLKTTHYRNGDPIANLLDSSQWSNDLNGAYCNYNNDTANGKIYGCLYNWYAVNNPAGISPPGWHIPTDSEWSVLINYLGGDSIAGGAMKATGITFWNPPNTGATNNSGFAGLPGGNRLSNQLFYGINNYGHFWSSSELNDSTAWSQYLYYNDSKIYHYYSTKGVGFSCRCIKDASVQ
jgi:uncharacterized protein (TIGR02145 family)